MSYIIGVAGASGSGKTTIVQNVLRVATPSKAVAISHDDYYRDLSDVPAGERTLVNYDHPNSLETELLIKHITALKAGNIIQKPTYDFAENNRAAEDICFIRRLKRDIAERGRTVDDVISRYLTTVRPMYLEFVAPSRRHADIIIPEGGQNTVALDLLLARVEQIVSKT